MGLPPLLDWGSPVGRLEQAKFDAAATFFKTEALPFAADAI
jgi:hypothetical protein